MSPGSLTWSGNIGTTTYTSSATLVTITATASDGSIFTGWGGDCTGTTTTCTIKMTSSLSVIATFILNPPKPQTLTVTKVGTGSGKVTVSPGSLTWSGNTGTTTYTDTVIEVILTSAASDNSTFSGWEGDCSTVVKSLLCTLTMNKDMDVTANFVLNRTLTINITGSGSGSVKASKGIIYWDFKTGVVTYAQGTEDTLTAVIIPDSDSTFDGWTGCDSTNGTTCTVKMTDSKTVSAAFSKASTVRVKNDFDGDGKSDIFWQDSSNGDTAIWFVDGMKVSSKGYPDKGLPSAWRFLAKADFNGDGKTDSLWQNTLAGDPDYGKLAIWFMDGSNITEKAFVSELVDGKTVVQSIDTSVWQFSGVGDFNGDGKNDILWHNISQTSPEYGKVAIWLMDGRVRKSRAFIADDSESSSWRFRDIGDYNGDGKYDILLQDVSNGNVAVWFMKGTSIDSKGFVEKGVPNMWKIK
ncbi:hypothetical protein MBAV_003422 [Candidatus Magnetobacterium bavaricum]|uniref:Bacterial repeat domain-containing protein n=1 Tax=Candidatus Magnetobacterium bavaricum TaxID=29290 RepID=A0A0F3GQZ9_9BACT|nr:hypothetical protein MBAV_003422 [Candidatus Magnetobacterium bavaricum]